MNSKGSKRAVEPLRNIEDVTAIGAYLKERDAETGQAAYIIWLLCVNGGFRIGDILKLRVFQLCGKGKRIHEYIELREEKRGKAIKRKIPAQVRPILQAYINGLDWKSGIKFQSYLFESARNPGRPYSYQWINDRLKAAAIVCGINQPVTTHTMRKTFAYHYFQTNKNKRDLFSTEKECLDFLSHDILKHGSIAETLRYTGIQQDLIDKTTGNVCFL